MVVVRTYLILKVGRGIRETGFHTLIISQNLGFSVNSNPEHYDLVAHWGGNCEELHRITIIFINYSLNMSVI